MQSAFTAYLKDLERCDRSPATIRGYRTDLESFAAWWRGTNGDAAPLSAGVVTPDDIRDFHSILTRSHKPASVNRTLAALRGWLRFAAAPKGAPEPPPCSIKGHRTARVSVALGPLFP